MDDQMHDNGAATAAAPPPVTRDQSPVYDPAARNRFELTVRHTDGKTYDTVHIYGPLSDDRYLQWLGEFKIRGNDDDVSEESREASVRLWNDTIIDVGGITLGEGKDFRDFISSSEKVESLNKFLAVALSDQDAAGQGLRRLDADPADEAQECVVTEAWFNSDVAVQRHYLKPVTDELTKKYARIQAKRFKQEKVGGLRRKPKIEYVPQDAAIGELYDEMFNGVTGFAGTGPALKIIPLRFKTFVIHHIFADTVAEKK